MNEVRSPTLPRVRVEIEPHELVDELAHAHVHLPFEPRTIEPTEKEAIEEEVVERADADGLPLPDIDRDDSGGGGHSSGEGERGDQFVFVDGQPLLTNADHRPVRDGAFDADAVAAGFLDGGLDLVAEGGLVRMVLNGRLRLSSLSTREDRRAAAALTRPVHVTAPEIDLAPYGPRSVRFDLAAEPFPAQASDETFGLSYAQTESTLRRAIDAGSDEDFARLNAEVHFAYQMLRSVAEVHPDLAFQEFKMLFADFGTDAFSKRLPQLAEGRVDARRWVQGWHRLDPDGREAIARALSPGQLAFLLADAEGRIDAEPGAPRDGARRAHATDRVVRFVHRRVGVAEWSRALDRRTARLATLLERPVPAPIAFGGDAAFTAAVLGLAKRAREGDTHPFTERVLASVELGEDRDGAFVQVGGSAPIRPDAIDAFARATHAHPTAGLLDRWTSADPALAGSVDPLAVATHVALQAEGHAGGLRADAPLDRVASRVWGAPMRAMTFAPAEHRGALADADALVVVRDGARRAAAAWGRPSLSGIEVRAEDLAATNGARDALTRGLTNLANTLERAGRPADEVEALATLKSRANRLGVEPLEDVRTDVLDWLRAHVSFDPIDEHVTVSIVTVGDGRPQFTTDTNEDQAIAWVRT